jgi:hypothetical protein
MFVALVIVTALLSAIAVASAVMKLRKAEQVISTIHGTVGVPMRWLPALAALEIAGALGILAATGLVLYFLGAVIGHLRVGDSKGAGQPVLPLLLSVAVLVLRIATT